MNRKMIENTLILLAAIFLCGMVLVTVKNNQKYRTGDLNLDNKVDALDFALMMKNYKGKEHIQITEVEGY
jgi:hypothetical protein